MTTQQMKYARFLLHRSGMDKDEAVYAATGGRTTHLTEMHKEEFDGMMRALVGETARDRMIKKIISMGHEMGWELPDGKIDMGRINAWSRKYTRQKTDLDKIKADELPAVVSVFEKVYLTFLKGI